MFYNYNLKSNFNVYDDKLEIMHSLTPDDKWDDYIKRSLTSASDEMPSNEYIDTPMTPKDDIDIFKDTTNWYA